MGYSKKEEEFKEVLDLKDLLEFAELLECAYKTIGELRAQIDGLELEQLGMQADIEKYKNTIEILRRL